MLDVRKLRVLCSVVTSGSISAAAANLGYTPSAVSQQVAALEREAGASLLEKAGRGVRPTAAGTLLAEHAVDIMAKLAAAETALADLRVGRTGRLRVHYFATAGAELLPPAVAEFRARRPSVQLELRLREPANTADSALAGEADIQLVVLPQSVSPHSIPGTDLVHLLDDPYRLVLPRGHRLADRDDIELAELADDPWIDNELPPGMCRKIMMDAFASAGFTPEFVVESDDYPTAQGFVAAGLGVTMIPELGLGAVHSGVEVRRVRHPEPVRCIYAAVPVSTGDHPLVKDMLFALVSAARRR
jgi:DNA-binding transcriptional LysR family regulator